MAFPDLYKRSLFFEILSINEKGGPQRVLDSFAFTIPPSSINYRQTQRITKTPTPGGWFIDNYGLGSCQITINGETGNEESRLTILGSGKAPRSLTGQEAYFEFRDRIERASDKYSNFMIRFYDLTNKGAINLFAPVAEDRGRVSRFSNAWEVTLDESGLQRGSSKPFFYPYSITLTGLRPLGTFDPQQADNRVGFLSDVRGFIDSTTLAVEEFNANLDVFVTNNSQYLDDITGIFTSLTAFSSSLTAFADQIIEYEQKIGGQFSEVLSNVGDTLSNGIQLISFPYDVLDTARQQLVNIRNQAEGLFEKVVLDGGNVLSKYDWNKDIDPVSELSSQIGDIEESFYPVVLTGKQDSAYEPIGAVSFNGAISPVYGYTEYTVKGTTRLDRLARDFFGDSAFKDVISGLNDIYSNDELVPGTMLLLPILEPDVRFANNAVYNAPGELDDVLGRDAKVDEDGIFVVDANDYVLTVGIDTVLQAAIFRLSEKRGRQIQDNIYGITAQIGDALNDDSPFEYLAVSLKETLVQDPRITDVYGLDFGGTGDNLYQEFQFDTITRTGIVYKEGL